MGLISRTGDIFYAFRFLKMLTTPWDKQKAFELGIIDENGTVLKKARELKNSDEKASYTVFHRLVFNLKRLLNKLPFGKSKLASYATALFLIKEETGMSENQIRKVMKKFIDDDADVLEESTWFQTDEGILNEGDYWLINDIASPITGEIIAETKTKIRVNVNSKPVDKCFYQNIYKVTHLKTKQELYITSKDIKR